MKKIGMLSMAILLTAGVAVAGESTMESESQVKEKTTQSTTTVPGSMDQTGEVRHKSTTVEKRHQMTSDGMDGDSTTREKVEVEKKRSKTTTESSDEGIPGATQEYHQQSETHHQHSTTVEKR